MTDLATALIAATGAITGILSLYFHYVAHRHDKYDLKLRATMSIGSSLQIRKPHFSFELEMVNVGRRICVITAISIPIPTGAGADILPPLPPELAKLPPPEQWYSLLSPPRSVALTEHKPEYMRSEPFPEDIAGILPDEAEVCVTDSTGKVHKASFTVPSRKPPTEKDENV